MGITNCTARGVRFLYCAADSNSRWVRRGFTGWQGRSFARRRIRELQREEEPEAIDWGRVERTRAMQNPGSGDTGSREWKAGGDV